ncbi:MAG: penicillin-insensitive murein endopeptidase, partial [Methylocella sp.]
MHRLIPAILALCIAVIAGSALAQTATDKAALAAMSKAAAAKTPAKEIFGSQKRPTNLASRAIGFYAKGCLAGGKALPVNGPAWQVMRLSRNRNWGHPSLVSLIEKLATEAKQFDGWNGLMVGDLSQPRGGPMLSGHASHQVGLDADVWLTQMPDRVLTDKERENIEATVVTKDRKTIDKKVWTEAHARLIKRAASYPQVARIFVNPPIKAELCKWAAGDRSWLAKVRPYYNHNYHFHIRVNCPKGSANCKNQAPAQPK